MGINSYSLNNSNMCHQVTNLLLQYIDLKNSMVSVGPILLGLNYDPKFWRQMHQSSPLFNVTLEGQSLHHISRKDLLSMSPFTLLKGPSSLDTPRLVFSQVVLQLRLSLCRLERPFLEVLHTMMLNEKDRSDSGKWRGNY